jgi:threonine dehydratase
MKRLIEEARKYLEGKIRTTPVEYSPKLPELLREKCFAILKDRVDEVALIKEEELKPALLWLLENHQYLMEPTSAAALAAPLFGYVKPKGPTVIVLSGQNVSYATVSQFCR